ncbi:MAG TPA: twin-arginine translocase subunit TatC, partial [Polyangiaceae bacterium]
TRRNTSKRRQPHLNSNKRHNSCRTTLSSRAQLPYLQIRPKVALTPSRRVPMIEPENSPAMSFWDHLNELRSRLVRSILAVAVGVGLAWTFREPLLGWLTRPYASAWVAVGLGDKPFLHFPGPADLFFAYLKLSVIGGFVFALPIVFYQLWAFVAPGLYSRERRLAIPFVLSSSSLFAGGVYFGWRVALPLAYRYLLSLSGKVSGSNLSVLPTIMIEQYLDSIAQMLIAFGLAFELPVLALFLSLAGIINHRHLIRFARYFIVVAFVVAAIVTPPDIVSQLVLAIPLCLLYALSILVAWIFGRSNASPSALSIAKAEPPK